MKKIIAIIIAMLAIFLVVPKFFAQPIEHHLDTIVKQLDSTPGYRVFIVERTSNWFTSSAVLAVKVDANALVPTNTDKNKSAVFQLLSANITLDIQHGPILIADGLSLGLAAWTIETDNDLLRKKLVYADKQSLYSIYGVTDFFGNNNFNDEIAAFTTMSDAEVNFSGWLGQGSLSLENSFYSGSTDTIAFINSNTVATSDNIELKIKTDSNWLMILDNPIYNSTVTFSIDSASINTSNTMPITLDKLIMSAQTQVKNNNTLMDVNINYAFNKIEHRDLLINDFSLDLQINNLAKEFLKAYQNIMQDPEGPEKGLQHIVQNNLLAQLQASPELNIEELSVNINGHHFSSSLATKIYNVQALPLRLNDSKFWSNHTNASANIKMDKKLVLLLGEFILLPQFGRNQNTRKLPIQERKTMIAGQIKGMVYALISQGIFVENVSSYESSMLLDKGVATLNGQIMPLPF
jgi:uncharacterized protein YdgA (DUF945 family)